jgi:hypothetical protein
MVILGQFITGEQIVASGFLRIIGASSSTSRRNVSGKSLIPDKSVTAGGHPVLGN